MKLMDLFKLSTDFNSLLLKDKISYYEKAYKLVAEDLRLNMGLFPTLMSCSSVSIGGFEKVAKMASSGSLIAFKELKDFVKVNFIQDGEIKNTDGYLLIGDPSEEYFGFDKEIFESVNNNHKDIPVLFQSKDYLLLANKKNIDKGFFHILGYMYPYPVLVEEDYTEVEHRYDVNWMIDTYGLEDILVDNMLGMLVLIKANHMLIEDKLDISLGNNINYIYTTLVNIYNRNQEHINNNKLTKLSLMNF